MFMDRLVHDSERVSLTKSPPCGPVPSELLEFRCRKLDSASIRPGAHIGTSAQQATGYKISKKIIFEFPFARRPMHSGNAVSSAGHINGTYRSRQDVENRFRVIRCCKRLPIPSCRTSIATIIACVVCRPFGWQIEKLFLAIRNQRDLSKQIRRLFHQTKKKMCLAFSIRNAI